jgi:hypothetical protein
MKPTIEATGRNVAKSFINEVNTIKYKKYLDWFFCDFKNKGTVIDFLTNTAASKSIAKQNLVIKIQLDIE